MIFLSASRTRPGSTGKVLVRQRTAPGRTRPILPLLCGSPRGTRSRIDDVELLMYEMEPVGVPPAGVLAYMPWLRDIGGQGSPVRPGRDLNRRGGEQLTALIRGGPTRQCISGRTRPTRTRSPRSPKVSRARARDHRARGLDASNRTAAKYIFVKVQRLLGPSARARAPGTRV